jgi:WhiB family redox-sensing transcriptional regulator
VSLLDFKHRLETDDDWMAVGACRGLSDIFFAPLAERPQTRERREARARQVCLQCPVLETCRSYAREHREYGFWGGENEEQRHSAGFRLIAPVGVRY